MPWPVHVSKQISARSLVQDKSGRGNTWEYAVAIALVVYRVYLEVDYIKGFIDCIGSYYAGMADALQSFDLVWHSNHLWRGGPS
jgi:hypothetical protein